MYTLQAWSHGKWWHVGEFACFGDVLEAHGITVRFDKKAGSSVSYRIVRASSAGGSR